MVRNRKLAAIAAFAALTLIAAACSSSSKKSQSASGSTTTVAPASANDRGSIDGRADARRAVAAVRRPVRHLQLAAHADHDGGRRDQRRRRRQRQAGRGEGRRRRHESRRRVELARHAAHLRQGRRDRRPGCRRVRRLASSTRSRPTASSTCSGSNTSAELSVAGGAGRRLLLPHRAVRTTCKARRSRS